MTAITTAPRALPAPVAIPVREWLPWALFVGFVMLSALYLVGLDQGATSLFGGHVVHEWVHDARHLLGFPCH
ncbi:MAG TPA: CbtB-domain containing protein [Acidimicrobiia bacterium]|nr:CbtB-domain containing protein [Acidimicrobiia bacterium]